MPWSSAKWNNSLVTLGAYRLGQGQIDQLEADQSRPVEMEELESLPANIKEIAELRGGDIYLPVERWLATVPADRVNKGFQPGERGTASSIGDIRIRYRIVAAGPVSVIAEQQGKSFVPHSTSGGNLDLIRPGLLSASEMFGKEHEGRKLGVWATRVAGAVCLTIGSLAMTGLVMGVTMIFRWHKPRISLAAFLLCVGGTVITTAIIEVFAWVNRDLMFAFGWGVAGAICFIFVAVCLILIWKPSSTVEAIVVDDFGPRR
jgi:hypothetical protein